MNSTTARYHQIPLEKRIKRILDRIHKVRGLIKRAEYEEKYGPADCEAALRLKMSSLISTNKSVLTISKNRKAFQPGRGGWRDKSEELPAIQSDLDPQCLRKNLKPIVFLIGGPNSATKDMAKMIEQKYDLTLISVGNLIEKEVKEGTPMGQLIGPTVQKGNLIRPDIAVWLLKREMFKLYRCSKGFLIEGFPRTQEQLMIFENEVARAHVALFLRFDNSTLEEMLLSPQMMGEKRDNFLAQVCNYQQYTALLRNDLGKRCKGIPGGGGRSTWKWIDGALAKMMLEWCFLKKDVTGLEDLHCDGKIEINYSNLLMPDVRGEQNKEFGGSMFKTLGGVVPYFVERDCTRKPLGVAELELY